MKPKVLYVRFDAIRMAPKLGQAAASLDGIFRILDSKASELQELLLPAGSAQSAHLVASALLAN